MKIVIDIPKERYNYLVERVKENKNRPCEHLPIEFEVIANGTPLPKGHGRLIDADELENRMKIGYRIVRDAPTIIEADKAGEEE